MVYEVQKDFDEPVQHFAELTQLYKALKSAEHIFVYDADSEKYQQMAEEFCVIPDKEPFYIETSVSTEGVFVQSVEAWINDHMVGEFYNPEKRPYIEEYTLR